MQQREDRPSLFCRCVRMTYCWWTSWTVCQVRGSVFTGEASLRKRRRWWMAFPWWHNVLSPVQPLFSTSSGRRGPGHTCGTPIQVHGHITSSIPLQKKCAMQSEKESLWYMSGYFPLRPFVPRFTQASLVWLSESVSSRWLLWKHDVIHCHHHPTGSVTGEAGKHGCGP
jgi:hypothetical protein